MNAKQIKYYEILGEFFASDMFKAAAVDKYFGAMLKLDYALAEDLWEYMLIKNDDNLKNAAFAALYLDHVYGLFSKTAAAKVTKTLVDRPVIMRAIFRFSPSVKEGELFALPISLLVANKTDTVDAILKHVAANEAMKCSFGAYMIDFLDRAFIEMMKKDAQRRVKLSAKQATLLTATVQKVKGDERAMLIQRVKEVK